MRRRLVAGLLLTALLGGCGMPDEQVTSGSTTTAAPGAGWEQLPPSPLSPRGGAVLATLENGGLLVVGGDMVAGCNDHRASAETPTSSTEAAISSGVQLISTAALSCAGFKHDPRLTDGAILESPTGEWRKIAEAPAPVSAPSTGVVVGDTVYFASWPSFATDGPMDGTWMAYEVSEDEWRELADPPVPAYNLVRAGDRLIAFHGSEERGPVPDLLYDPATDSWSELPRDPLSPSFDRVMVWTGSEVVLLGNAMVPNPGADGPSLVRAAAFDPATNQWRRLPDSEVVGGYPTWWSSGGKIVNAAVQTADGGQVGNWGRDYPHGGILDPGTGEWIALPQGSPPVPDCHKEGGSWDSDPGPHAAGPSAVVSDGLVLHVGPPRWEAAPCNSSRPNVNFVSTWAFDGVVTFGGYDEIHEPGQMNKYEFSNTAWLWRPQSG